jgi:hypothetical protein
VNGDQFKRRIVEVGRVIAGIAALFLMCSLTGCTGGAVARDPGVRGEQHDTLLQLRDEGIYLLSVGASEEGLEIWVHEADQRAIRKISEVVGEDARVVIRESSESLFVRGVITKIFLPGDKVFFGHLKIFVEGAVEPDTDVDRAYIVIGDETRILKADERGYLALPYRSLKIGQHVEVWVVGTILQSLPPTAGAVKILVTD